MTREEAIKMLKYNSNVIHKTIHGETSPAEVEALDMAIKALEQEQTTKSDLGIDCVSRQFMYELGATCIATRNENGQLIALGAIEELPSVTPQEPTTKNDLVVSVEEINELASFSIETIGQSDRYLQGMCNGIEYMRATLTNSEPHFFKAESEE